MSENKSTKFRINYSKINLVNLKHLEDNYESHCFEDSVIEYNPFRITKLQNYNPIYNDFFDLNENNYNKIALNNKYHISTLNEVYQYEDKTTLQKPIFIKFGPLLDPIRYMIGKYNIDDDKIRTLPSLTTTTNECLPKLLDKNNTSYIDNFFCFLTSKLLQEHKFSHGLDYYGSFVGLQEKYKMNVMDDLEYLQTSSYFNENVGKHFTCPFINNKVDFTNFGSRSNKLKLNISNKTELSDVSVLELDTDDLDISIENIESDTIIENVYEKTESVKSVSSISSSNSSNNSETNYSTDDDESVKESDSVSGSESDDDNGSETCSYESSNSADESDSSCEDSNEEQTESSEEEDIFAYIHNFPVQMICLEKCDGTIDDLFDKSKITLETGSSAMMQIVMSLITYQKTFHFTHNDLHTNNIMYVNTEEEYLYYKFNHKTYKVPTYGKIYKIIDFGRGIYKFQGKIYCSDSFAAGGDGHTQYNCEPFMNENKPRIDPNYSFDLCRLGCSIYDFIIDDDENEDEYDELQKTIHRWCLDDNGKNVLYKKNGEERYPNFKLYKMIARTVHHHTPQEQLKFPLFSQYETKDEVDSETIMDIDSLPDYSIA
uniref:Protein kinase domain-containing protein n=1 Tax=viral metagenome TaxID=1070528 RepID=A0A6C0HB55_9ZZZZ